MRGDNTQILWHTIQNASNAPIITQLTQVYSKMIIVEIYGGEYFSNQCRNLFIHKNTRSTQKHENIYNLNINLRVFFQLPTNLSAGTEK